MKNTKKYAQRIGKILARVPKAKAEAEAEQCDAGTEEDPITVLIEGVIQSDAAGTNTNRTMAALEREFVDFNELRVAPLNEIAHYLGAKMPRAHEKAEMLSVALNAIFYQQNRMCMDYMRKMKRRPLRRHLSELGLNAYAAGYTILMTFNMPSLPVDDCLLESLKMNGDLPENLDIEEAQRFLERTLRFRDMVAAHKCLRDYVLKNVSALAKKRRAEARAKAKAEAEAKARAEARAKAKAEAEAKAKAKAKKRGRAKTTRARKVAKKPAKTYKKVAARAGKKRAARRAGTKTRTKGRVVRKKKKKKK